jgi:hypothetical protein
MSAYIPAQAEVVRACLTHDLGPCLPDSLDSQTSVSDAYKLWLSRSALKKFKDLEASDAHDLAVAKFLSYNEKCKSFTFTEATFETDAHVDSEVTRLLDTWLHPNGCPFTFADMTRVCELGSGANLEVGSNNFYTKMFDWKITEMPQMDYIVVHSGETDAQPNIGCFGSHP